MEFCQSNEGPHPMRPVNELRIQAAVICAAERLFERQVRVNRTSNALMAAVGGCLKSEPVFNDFLDQVIVRGLVAFSPLLLELERGLGLVETMAPDDLSLLCKTLASELEQIAGWLKTLPPDRCLTASAVGAVADAGRILRVAAELNT